MQHIITNEEIKIFWDTYNAHQGHCHQATITALTDFLNNRPQVAQLRPIAEMPDTVPEGCKRITVGLNLHGNINNMCANGHSSSGCSLFVDLQLPTPDPEAEERRQFEEAMKKHALWKFERFPNGVYKYHTTETSWLAWKLAKTTTV